MKEIILKTRDFVKKKLENEGSGHDWLHTWRVEQLALSLGQEEKANLDIVSLAALLHDVWDWKAYDGDETIGPRMAREWLFSQGMDEEIINHVAEIITHISYKGAGVPTKMRTIEGQVVQDADRLDAIGAIGIARVFTYGGYKKRPMHLSGTKPRLHTTKEEYFSGNGSTIDHFYEKLLLLKERMNTATGKKMAEGRHHFMEKYLEQFFAEWEGKR